MTRGWPAGSFEERLQLLTKQVTHGPGFCHVMHGDRSHAAYVDRAYADVETLIGDAYRNGLAVKRIAKAIGWTPERATDYLRLRGFVVLDPPVEEVPKALETLPAVEKQSPPKVDIAVSTFGAPQAASAVVEPSEGTDEGRGRRSVAGGQVDALCRRSGTH